MSEYLFIQSQDPFTEKRVESQYDLAVRLSKAGNIVRVLLIQNGVIPARKNSTSKDFDKLINSPVKVFVDGFSLRQREINSHELKDYVEACDLDIVVEAMLAKIKVIWN